jgi:hypothetical protein
MGWDLAKPIACFGFRDGFASLNPSYGLITGALGPASDVLTRTPRRCVLINPSNRPMRPIVREIREWIVAQLRADVEAIDLLYPQLGLLAAGY